MRANLFYNTNNITHLFLRENVFNLTHDFKKLNDIILLPKQTSPQLSTDIIKKNPTQ